MPGTGQASVEAQGWVGALPSGNAPQPDAPTPVKDEPREEAD